MGECRVRYNRAEAHQASSSKSGTSARRLSPSALHKECRTQDTNPFIPTPLRLNQPTLRKGSALKATAWVGGDWRSIWALGECVGSSSDPLFRSSKRGEQGLTMSRSICSRLSCRPPREISATLGTRRETPREARPARDLGRELARRLAGKLFVLHLHWASGEGVDGGRGWGVGWQAGGGGQHHLSLLGRVYRRCGGGVTTDFLTYYYPPGLGIY